MFLGPAADLCERRQQGSARVGERVGHRERRSLPDRAGDESGIGQLAEPVGEHRIADPLDGTGERAEAGRPAAQRPEHHPGPALAEQVERTHQRPVRAAAGLGVQTRYRSGGRGSHRNKTSTFVVAREMQVPSTRKGMGTMQQEAEVTSRDAILVEDAHIRPMMGFEILEPLPSRSVPYAQVDPFILVHEARFRLSELQDVDTKHPHRGFDNLWYILEGSASTGHSTGPDGAIERARLPEGALLALRTGKGAWHAEGIGAEQRAEGLGDTEWRSVLFWVNLARKDKQAEPSAQVLLPEQITVRQGRRRDGPGARR